MPKSTLHGILHNRIYTGDFEWLGKKHRGTHEPLVTYEMWERVQGILDGRGASKVRESSHAFAFSGLITCGHCGCTMVAEIKKLQKRRLKLQSERPLERSPTAFLRSGSPGRTRTSDPVVNSHLLYQLSYRGSGTVRRPAFGGRRRPQDAGL